MMGNEACVRVEEENIYATFTVHIYYKFQSRFCSTVNRGVGSTFQGHVSVWLNAPRRPRVFILAIG